MNSQKTKLSIKNGWVKFLLHGSLALISAFYISGCGNSVPRNTQVYEVNGARTCDTSRQTFSTQDDCDNNSGSAGYFYHPGNSTIFYRSGSGQPVIVERNVPRHQTTVGGNVPLRSPVITNETGVPLTNGNSVVTRSTSSTAKTTAPSKISTTPVRSTASFEAPGIGRVNAGRTTTTGRGLSFGRSGFGGAG